MNTISLSLSGTANLFGAAYRSGAALPENGSCPDASTRAAGPDRSGENAPGCSGAPDSPEKDAPDTKTTHCTANTDAVDREIEKLEQERQKLEQQLRSETDEAKRQKAQQRLEQVERELSQKDNDAYRRRQAVYTYF